MTFVDDLKHLLLIRNNHRKGGEIFSIKDSQLQKKYNVDLRILVNSMVIKTLENMNYLYLKDKSNDIELFFLDLSRGKQEYEDKTCILGYFYEDGRVISYITDTINKSNGNK